MEYEDNAVADQDQRTVYQVCGNGQNEPSDSNYDLQPPAAMPPTVLVTELNNGTLILQGRPDGPRVRLSADDAIPLKRELVAAFGRTKSATAGDDQDEAR